MSAPRCSRPLAKAFATDIGCEVASLGVQVHGGMGYVEETGAAQHFRDARIAPIYEGTNGIQAIDLVTRKLPLAGGAARCRAYLDELRRTVASGRCHNDPAFGWTGVRLREALDSLERATHWLLARAHNDAMRRSPAPRPICGCSRPRPAARCWPRRRWRRAALLPARGCRRPKADPAGRIAIARFFAENIAVQARGLERSVIEGADSVTAATAALE